MNKLLTKVGILLGILCISSTGITLAQNGAAGEIFGMQCSWPEEVDTSSMTDNSDILFKFQSGAILANTTSGYVVADPDAEKYRLLSHLEKKGYTSINKFDTLFVGERKMNVVLGQNCGESVIRLNATTYLDKIGIIDVESDGDYINIYYQAGVNNKVSAIVCDPFLDKIEQTYTQEDFLFEVVYLKETLPGMINTPEKIFNTLENTLPSPEKTITEYNQLKAGTLHDLVKQRGYDRSTDRLELAKQAGLDMKTYRGTKEQNLQIKRYLLEQIKPDTNSSVIATNTSKISVPENTYPTVKKAQLRNIVTLWGYIRKTDRLSIAKEFGFDIMSYFGTKTQNLQIRKWLLSKISPRK